MPKPRRPPLLGHSGEGPNAELEVTAFNPLHPKPLGESVARALEAQPVHPLPPELPFNGAGVYAIYYHSESLYYRAIAAENRAGNTQPIYFGKADPRGGRKGVFVEAVGRVLYNRLKSDHADSVAEVEANTTPSTPGYLRLEDFKCRFLVVEPVWIPLIESLSITTFSQYGMACSTASATIIRAIRGERRSVRSGTPCTLVVSGQRGSLPIHLAPRCLVACWTCGSAIQRSSCRPGRDAWLAEQPRLAV